jgi:hypothetical protein
MSDKIGNMTADELKDMIGEIIEEKLIELFGDPEDDLGIREPLKARLRQQMKDVAEGDRGKPLMNAARRLELA